jgi:hypothetical protein
MSVLNHALAALPVPYRSCAALVPAMQLGEQTGCRTCGADSIAWPKQTVPQNNSQGRNDPVLAVDPPGRTGGRGSGLLDCVQDGFNVESRRPP